jgi:penicillin G amidase
MALVLLALLVVGGATAWLYRRTRAAFPELDGNLQFPGLQSRVEVLRDEHGVPHLRAQSLEDLAFAQGFVTAQDRLFQMDLSRRLAMGQLSEILGETVLRYDIENRTLGFPQACERAAAELDPDSRKLLDAYTAGVNAFITSHSGRLPVEFLLLRYTPRPWRPADSFGVAINMAKSLNTSWPEDLSREAIRAKVSPELYADLYPDHSDLDHPVAETVSAKSAPQPRSQTKGPGDVPQSLTLAALLAPTAYSDPGVGSNNWVVSGAHTQSGKPLLANDPHLSHSIPSVWYMIHLKAPGLDVSGVSLPGLPLVIIGHNQRIAWGMTNTAPDVQDLYAESFNFREANKYLHNGEWVDADVREETIKVHGAGDYHLTVKTTRHGPVISHDGDRDLALRWTAIEPHALRFPFLEIDRAGNWQEFTQALRNFTGPTQNFVYADVDGNIGYYAAGWIPIRAEGDGSIPVQGSTDDYDWTGFIPFEELPQSYNPASGLIATANGRIVPDDYPYFITRRWAEPFRTARIYQLLEAKNGLTVSDMLRVQSDILSLEDQWLAGELVNAAKAHPPASDDAKYAMSLLEKWDGEARADSGAALVCEVTRRELLDRILRPKLGDETLAYDWSLSTVFLQNVLRNNWTRWLPTGDGDFNATLIKSLEKGVAEIPSLVGSRDHKAWQWGQTIPLTFHNHLSGPFPFLRKWLDVGPVPQSGAKETVKQTTPTLGPSMRMVVDFSDFEMSVQNITLGESGQAMSPYYKDQFDDWYHGRSFPMLFSDRAVEQGTRHKLVLEPSARP